MNTQFLIGSSVAGTALAVSLLTAVPAQALTFTGSGTNPASTLPISAAADFSTSGSNLVVQLTNTSAADVLVPSDVLTAVFFTLPGNPTLSRVSALLAPGSQVFYDPQGQPAGGVVGGEWTYRTGINVSGASQGTSSTGLGIFGPGDRFPGADLQAPTSPNGVEYGILSAGDNTATGNSGVLNSGGLIKNSVIFTLSGLPTGFNLSGISNVSFQYGTALNEPRIPGTPGTPIPTPALLPGLVAFAVAALRKQKQEAQA